MSIATEISLSLFLGNRKLLQDRTRIEKYVLRPVMKHYFQLAIHKIIWDAIYRDWTGKDI